MNASAVSRVLAKTYTRSKTEGTTIRGYATTSAGFFVRQYERGVGVYYTTGSWNSKSDINTIKERKTQMIESIKQTLVKNGFELSNDAEGIFVIGKTQGDNK